MRKIALFAYGEIYYGNDRIFDPDWMKDLPLGNSWGFYFGDLKDRMEKLGWSLSAPDPVRDSLDGFEKILFFDMPNKIALYQSKILNGPQRKYLVQSECSQIVPENWRESNYSLFDRVFTWSPDLKGEKFVRYYWPNRLELPDRSRFSFQDKKMCVMVAGNKKNKSPNELYSERRKVLDWFELNHPDDLDLYGNEWNLSLRKKTKEFFKNMARWSRGEYPVRIKDYSIYRGRLSSKEDTLPDYKFNFCYENMKDVPGYITEKIFDSFSCGVVPIYWGWKGVSSLIPEEAFIDARRFDSINDIYGFISSMDESSHRSYLDAAVDFLTSQKASLFSGDAFIRTLVDGMGIH
ncbi:hypothetical protein Dpep_0230 [Dethiosulfovibrio peptidovorans DSM 11002]|uniref:Fucosyltransferase C-terminal domain-containing protein n=1 Tax=Dethiosulfovibrio peptidovorans DSM 11002 TaxID=469381 RepID=D2Z344_9BACT|nr:glycosyltransferase family 10 [Dethiosulfovibrio peptidovorans]EFC90262.1 hypothetical protein Dpep_0230 [Dethiosulfovibrio peptidovorans DSM 11002]